MGPFPVPWTTGQLTSHSSDIGIQTVPSQTESPNEALHWIDINPIKCAEHSVGIPPERAEETDNTGFPPGGTLGHTYG